MRKSLSKLVKSNFEEISFEIFHQKFVPTPKKEPNLEDFEKLSKFIQNKHPLIISGAGLSTER